MRYSIWRKQRRFAEKTSVLNFIELTALLVFVFISSLLCFAEELSQDSLQQSENNIFNSDSSNLILRLHTRNDTLAEELAKVNGFRLKRSTPFLDSLYFLDDAMPVHFVRRRRKRSPELLETMRQHTQVIDVFEDFPRKRVKRDYIDAPTNKQSVDSSIMYSRRQKRRQSFAALSALEIPRLPFPDPLYQDQWYLVGRAVGGYDMNVREAWLMGYAGRGVSISILDDGIQRDHPDLISNYDPLASTDINDHDDDPTPQDNGDNKHGTRCAGEVAATAGNNVCGVGVAFHAKIGGVRMLDGPVSDSVEAASLSFNQNHIDIYSASWGPEDDGKTFDGPGNLAQEAFYRGIRQGRGGKGNIFVWASGNGGSRQDSCSADGYTTSIYTLSISSATFDNHRPWYMEECPSTIASTYSSANINQPAIVTVDVPNGCTKMHTGTSASAPLAAGIIALALEANPNLTWRDVQHIVLRTANPIPLFNNPGWSKNGVGRSISNKFGYGLMDAGAIVKLAKTWSTVPEQHMCTYEYSLDSPRPRPLVGNFQLNFSMEVNGCERGTPVLYLEHVQVVTTIRYGRRGDLRLTLFSPSGTRSILLPPRPQDVNPNGFHKWPFLSVQMWGEDPRGIWTLMVESVTNNPSIGGMFSDWSLLLYGTEDPAQPSDQRYPQMSQSRRLPSQSLVPQLNMDEFNHKGRLLDMNSVVFSKISMTTVVMSLQIAALIIVLGTAIYACYRYSAPVFVADSIRASAGSHIKSSDGRSDLFSRENVARCDNGFALLNSSPSVTTTTTLMSANSDSETTLNLSKDSLQGSQMITAKNGGKLNGTHNNKGSNYNMENENKLPEFSLSNIAGKTQNTKR